MILARTFEESAAEEYTKGIIRGFLHLYPIEVTRMSFEPMRRVLSDSKGGFR